MAWCAALACAALACAALAWCAALACAALACAALAWCAALACAALACAALAWCAALACAALACAALAWCAALACAAVCICYGVQEAARGVDGARATISVVLLDERDPLCPHIHEIHHGNMAIGEIRTTGTGREDNHVAMHRGGGDGKLVGEFTVAPVFGISMSVVDPEAKEHVAMGPLGALVTSTPLGANPVVTERDRARIYSVV